MLSERSFQIYTFPQLPVHHPALPCIITTTFSNSVEVKGEGPNRWSLSDEQQLWRPAYLDRSHKQRAEPRDPWCHSSCYSTSVFLQRESTAHRVIVISVLYFFLSVLDSRLPEGMGMGGLGEKGRGIKKYTLAITKQSWGCTVQHRNILSNIVITIYGARWALELSGEHFVKYVTV